ncbi:Formylglycine-generating enzyme, required for sulfatase activity, contains SUMF1/FGE domain [Saccharicrinis carchari]|uniref:Formylglycine-generating enzyme, required for sulfatase activity, contains SUMF1/FGE domain n=1 Tax=Saccharicrinis carchari TaxID=1168039 RepID=A0A521C0H6_SACCC|nr:NapC/NirT family cytochrome c [Saccharicrinis carchari]SMO52230.1 Formylglycine-generating enzyme, required for sulfatase activity, contains SUMF1/FGE domain [Saccharicrinis carchari]
MKKSAYPFVLFFVISFGLAIALVVGLQKVDKATSSDQYCISCHVHSHADNSWLQSSHHDNKSGVVVHCVECHLPPKDGAHYWTEKAKAGYRDLYSFYFKDTANINWEQKRDPTYAKQHTFEASCTQCHQNLFPLQLSKKGDEAHLHYLNNHKSNNPNQLHCINCHIDVGHGTPGSHAANIDFLKSQSVSTQFEHSTAIHGFYSFQEHIPGTAVAFDMIAIPGRERKDADQYDLNEWSGIEPFFMGKIEVTWDAYKAFLSDTESEGRTDTKVNNADKVDAITGATPPFGDPSQGWGMGQRPAITMTWHAANVYCQWLSEKTGKKYRLPTATEWYHACNANSDEDFFWGENINDYTKKGIFEKLFKATSDTINQYVIWSGNSKGKTALPGTVKPNNFGLLNMLGNVKEFCSDTIIINTDGGTSTEHRIMGGSFKSNLPELLLTHTDYTRHDQWMVTDPQIPKSIWWYSDCNDVGFRVVCEWDEE